MKNILEILDKVIHDLRDDLEAAQNNEAHWKRMYNNAKAELEDLKNDSNSCRD